jgi:hypothetical protein
VPKGYWRLPTSAEFEPDTYGQTFNSPGQYQKVEAGTDVASTNAFTWSGSTNDKVDGSYEVNNGYRLTYYTDKEVFFPAAGLRNMSGNLGNLGVSSGTWNSSAEKSFYSYPMLFKGEDVTPAYSSIRAFCYPVRCVKK